MVGGWKVDFLRDPVEDLNLGLPRPNPDSDREEDLKQEPPDFKSSALNHLTMPLTNI